MVFGDLLFLFEEALVAWVLGVWSGLKEETLSFSLLSGVRSWSPLLLIVTCFLD
jgi:hypothetical protein